MAPKIAVVARKVPRPTDLYGGLLHDMRLDPNSGLTASTRACCPDIEDLLNLKSSEALVKQLLQAGANPNSRNHCEWSEGWLPLMLTSSPEVAELLLDNGADITREADDGMIAIIAACARGKLAVVKILLKRGALEQLERVSNSNHTALSAAVNNQHEDVALLLLRHLVSQGFDINHPRLASNQPLWLASNQPLLCCAAGTGQCRVVEFALEHGADPNITGVNGPPVILAVRHGQLSIVKLLCERGANLQTCFGQWQNSLYAATLTRNVEMVKLLIKHGADVNAVANDGSTPAPHAALSGHCGILQMLLDAGATMDAQTQYNAVNNICELLDDATVVAVLKVLLPHCSNFADSDCQLGCEMLATAVSNGKLQAARALLAAGAYVNWADQNGSLMHYAAKSGSLAVVK
eukprot:1214-Heterococcus_DN1.PRE.1